MVHAFIMVKTSAGESERLLGPVRELPKVTEAHIVAGDYDIIAEVESEEVYDVLKTASSGVQGLQGVVDTRTYISMED
jgi:DNA-binding Lrp family transcriptional regulator